MIKKGERNRGGVGVSMAAGREMTGENQETRKIDGRRRGKRDIVIEDTYVLLDLRVGMEWALAW
jgi:hypothetical protein